ncbi:Heat-inducible transcription repressor HrcA [Corynebacterium felinum]|uniref:Heat-inducible transcription repressor HrcA n=2 Tax=Corynebacterium felinum TaxID=131318 RepID=A0ABU2B4E4_9CORY|nr:heat-inducible transcriptional repressor [Corynebacterium felinum]WJY95663.1 Heat-inducible transcription repressor HrcA [Corynebacterium felinum]
MAVSNVPELRCADRRMLVLRAIVADYIRSQEPVGSKALVERHKLDVSSATIRNDMAALEAEGYIVQQHKSSGRIPTHKAYRLFVDSLQEIKPLSSPQRRAIERFLEGAVDLEDTLRRSAQLLSQLTHQAAVVQMPTLKMARMKHCEVVLLAPTRLLLVVITDTGRVDQRNVELDSGCTSEQVADLRELLNQVLDGQTLNDASVSLAALGKIQHSTQPHLARCVSVLIDTLVEHPTDRLILAGTSKLPAFPTVLEALEEQVVMLKLLANVQDLHSVGSVSVLIGEETEEDKMSKASVVATGYGAGGLGVVGPTHMDYRATMSKVQAVAQYVSRLVCS